MYQDIQEVDESLTVDLQDILHQADLGKAVELTNDNLSKSNEPQETSRLLNELKERGMIWWWNEYVDKRNVPPHQLLLSFGVTPSMSETVTDESKLLSLLKSALLRFLKHREKRSDVNTIEDVLSVLRGSKNIMVLTGAGISVNCGIPDFRSPNGIYSEIRDNLELNLNDPQEMFDIRCFRKDPTLFYSFAHKMYPQSYKPSVCHRFIKLLEQKGKLLRVIPDLRMPHQLKIELNGICFQNYTQNIDTLEKEAGIERVLHCHGSFNTATCLQCRVTVPGAAIEEKLMSCQVPLCDSCLAFANRKKGRGKKRKRKAKSAWDSDESDAECDSSSVPYVMKPDITFFGERLPLKFDECLAEDREEVDALLIIGTSLNVAPVSEILAHIPHSVPQILINKTIIPHAQPDVILLGDADDIVGYLCSKLRWNLAINSAKDFHCTDSYDQLRPFKSAELQHAWNFDPSAKSAIVINGSDPVHLAGAEKISSPKAAFGERLSS